MARGCMAVLYHEAIFLLTQSFLISGGLVSKLTLGHKKLMFYDNVCQCFLRSME